MAINIPAAPAQSIAALRAALPNVVQQATATKVAPRLAASLTGANAAANLTPALSYQVYTLGLSDLAAAATSGLKAAKPSLWRHTLTSDGEVVTADTQLDSTGANFKFSALSTNPSATAVQTTVQTLNQDANVAKASYQLSLLQIPALGVRAV
jgi:hypothetical protein